MKSKANCQAKVIQNGPQNYRVYFYSRVIETGLSYVIKKLSKSWKRSLKTNKKDIKILKKEG